MTETIFYAWQSDIPANTNRTFIRKAIERAVEVLNAELGVEDALRADQDTQGIPGDVNVAEIIFEKIDRCRVFIADITTVTPAGAARPSPNPNVLIEYGRASVRPGSSSVVTVFNEAYGNWETDRPFDLRHRRKPILYNLPESHTDEQRTLGRRTLVSQLTSALRDITAAEATPISVPDASAFDALRQLYAKTPLLDQRKGRIIGFWCGMIPVSQAIRLEAPWDHIELVSRAKSFVFKRGNSSQKFETIDSAFSNGSVSFQPMKQGAQYICQHHYQGSHKTWCDDTVAVYIYDNGRIALVVRTNNLDPSPHLNRRWIMADVANTLEIMNRVRIAAQKPTTGYALFVELRYDDQANDIFRPVPTGEWRLTTLEDDTGQFGTLVPSTPVAIGPIMVGMANAFPSVLESVYTDMVTSAGRKPEQDLSFELIGTG